MKRGETMPESQRQSLAQANLGRKMTAEDKLKMSVSGRARIATCVCVVCSTSFVAKSGAAKYCNAHQPTIRRSWEEALISLKICDLCGKSRDEMMIDHCHHCGVVRGVLCRKCNIGLGWFDDNIENLQHAIAYLSSPPRHHEDQLYSGWRGTKKVSTSCTCTQKEVT